jgi:hypothetical protein
MKDPMWTDQARRMIAEIAAAIHASRQQGAGQDSDFEYN